MNEDTEIIFKCLSHQDYTKLVDYIESLPNYDFDYESKKPLCVSKIEKVLQIHPPVYEGVHILLKTSNFMPESQEANANALKGLADLFLSKK